MKHITDSRNNLSSNIDVVEKPTIAIPIVNTMIERDLVESGTLDTLSKSYTLNIYTANEVQRDKLSKFGNIKEVVFPKPRRRFLYDKTRRLNNIRRWSELNGEMANDLLLELRQKTQERIVDQLIILNNFGLGWLLIQVSKLIILLSRPRQLIDKSDRPVLILIPSMMRGIIEDDFIYWGKSNEIPTAFVQMNLDFLSQKSLIARPDFMALWGENSWHAARLLEKYNVEQLKVIGSPRFDVYRANKLSKFAVRKELGLPETAKIVLVCGGRNTPDTIVLEEIELGLSNDRFPEDTLFLYKPHPQRDARSYGYVDPDNVSNKSIRVVGVNTRKSWPPLEENQMLFSASDAMISTFSTTALEGAIQGLPILCLHPFTSQGDELWPDRYFLHLRQYYDTAWSDIGLGKESFIEKIVSLITKIGDDNISQYARGHARNVAYWDNFPYADRLLKFIDHCLSKSA